MMAFSPLLNFAVFVLSTLPGPDTPATSSISLCRENLVGLEASLPRTGKIMESLVKSPDSSSQLLVILPMATPLYLSDLNKTLESFRTLQIHPELSEIRLGPKVAARLVIEGLNKDILVALESFQKTSFLLIDLKPPESPRSASFLIGSLARKIPRLELLEWLNKVPGRIALVQNQKDASTQLLVIRRADFESPEGRVRIRQSLAQVRADYAPEVIERVENLLKDSSPTRNWERVASTRINEPHGYRRIKEYLTAQSGFFVDEAQPENSLVIIDLERKKAAVGPIRKLIAFEVDQDFIRLRARELLTQDVSTLLGDSRLSIRQKEFIELYRRSSGNLMARRESDLKSIAREDFRKREWLLTQNSEGQDEDLIFLLQHPKPPASESVSIPSPVSASAPEVTLRATSTEPPKPAPVSIWRANSSEDYRIAIREFVAIQEYADVDLLPIDELQRMAHKIPELLDSWEKFVFDLPSDLFESIQANSEAWNATDQVDEALRTKILKLLTLIKERQEGLRREAKVVELAKQVKIFGQKTKKQPSELAIQMARLLNNHLEPDEVSIVLEHIEIHPDLMSDLGYSPGRDVAKGLANKLLTLSKGISEAGAYLTQSISFRLPNVHGSVKFHRFAGNHLLAIMPADGRLLNDDPSKSFRFVVLSVHPFNGADAGAIRARSDDVRENR